MKNKHCLNYINLFLINVFCFTSPGISALDATLDGIWVEDKSKIIKGLSESNKEEALLSDCLEPKMAFSGGVVFVWQPDQLCEINGETVKVSSYYAQFDYAIKIQTVDTVVVKNLEKNTKSETVESYHFIDDDTFWIYCFGEKNQDVAHKRIYYKRLKDPKSIASAMKELEDI